MRARTRETTGVRASVLLALGALWVYGIARSDGLWVPEADRGLLWQFPLVALVPASVGAIGAVLLRRRRSGPGAASLVTVGTGAWVLLVTFVASVGLTFDLSPYGQIGWGQIGLLHSISILGLVALWTLEDRLSPDVGVAPSPSTQPGPAPDTLPATRPSGLAIGSLVCGLIALVGGVRLFFPGVIFGAVAIVLSVNASRIIARDPSKSGRGMATAGMIMGIFGLIYVIGVAIILIITFSDLGSLQSVGD